MSVEIQMTSTDDSVDFPYRTVSRAAVVSVFFALLSAIGLIPMFEPMLALGLIAIIAGIIGLRAVQQFPEEYSGRPLAMFGLIAAAIIVIGGASMHRYIYLTEVPDGYERVPFYQLQYGDGQGPDQPTKLAFDINGKPVFIKGYVHPSSGGGMLRQFVLVPDLGTCCFGGQPKSSDMIQVKLMGGQTIKAGLQRRKLAGTFTLSPAAQDLTDFDNHVFYKMRADKVK